MRRITALVTAVLCVFLMFSGEAHASDAMRIERSCFAYGNREAAIALPTNWDCDKKRVSLVPERVFLRFLLPSNGETPEYIAFRRAEFEKLHLMVLDADGSTRVRTYGITDTRPGRAGAFIRADLPEMDEDSRYVVAAFDLPTHPMMLETAELSKGEPADNPAQLRTLMLLACLCGMLLMPLAFNFAFYRVIREQFLLWHSVLAVTLLLTIALTSGVFFYLIELDMRHVNTAMSILYGVVVSAGAMFAWSFVEPGKLHPWLRNALPIAAAWSLIVSTLHAIFPFVLRPIQIDLAYSAYTPILLVFVIAMGDALIRGSRAVRFQLAGWVPMISVATSRVVSVIVPGFQPTDAMSLFYVGVVFQALATTLGVADRFLTIKRQRDLARTEADILERLSEHDPLTGLLNRRGIEADFAELRQSGYDTFALLDLDYFKKINDEFGHTTGDRVLRAVGDALRNQPDTMAVRMGGEEFALLLRGPNTQERAERLRQAIPVRVAHAVPELDRIVTASMGLLELPRNGIEGVGLKEFYARADKLLYDAKSGGRNRMIAERLQVFVPRKTDRRRVAA